MTITMPIWIIIALKCVGIVLLLFLLIHKILELQKEIGGEK